MSVRDLQSLAFHECSAADAVRRNRHGYVRRFAWLRIIATRTQMRLAVLDQADARLASEQTRRALDDGIEYWLLVRRTAADHLQDLRSRGLLLERLLRLVKQAHVLDGDHRLVGERL